MIRIQVQKITINYAKINKIKDFAMSNQLLNFMKQKGNDIVKEAKVNFPFSNQTLRETNNFYKKYPVLPHMKERLSVQKEKKTSFKFDGEKLNSWNVPISLNKVPGTRKLVYPYVMFAGKMRGRLVNYSNPIAKPFPVETTFRKHLPNFILETENLMRRIITNEFN